MLPCVKGIIMKEVATRSDAGSPWKWGGSRFHCRSVLNALLSSYLLRLSRRNHSLILEADGKRVPTDRFTSFGVVAGLDLVIMTGWKPFDPLVAFAVAANILWSGGRLMGQSMKGLLD
jgi:divalent metal cation (Fe/Co/Zn/Cd) transporter